MGFVTTTEDLRSEFSTSLKDHLTATRHGAGMTRKQLVVALSKLGVEVTEQAVGCWLRGETVPSLPNQAAIANVLAVPVRSLFPVKWEG